MSEDRKQQAWQHFHNGRLDESRQITHELLELDAADPQLRLLDGLISARQNRYADAEASLTAALQTQRSYRVLLSLGHLYLVTGKMARAEQYLQEAIELRPEMAEPRITLANVYAHQGKYGQAVEIYQWLADNGQADANVSGNLALSLEMLRRHEEARHAATEALKLDANHPEANLVLARLDRMRNMEHESIPRLQQAIISHQDTVKGANLLSELGHALDRTADYDSAFDAFRRANDIWQSVTQNVPFGKEIYLQRIEAYRRVFSAPTPNRAGGSFGDRLVFFVGFPRSGTTLVEQVMKTRPEIVTTQEAPLISDLITLLSGGKHRDNIYPKALAHLSDQDLADLRTRYIGELRQIADIRKAGIIYVDKFPLNIIDAGFIHMLFPAARFLVALRDPRDVCLSCFMQSFKPNQAMIHFLDIEDAARFYSATMDLWEHYKTVLSGLRYLEYRYEDLIDDFDATTKRILAFTGAEWTPDVRAFYKEAGKRVVRTPSFIDVSSPVYTRAVGRWKQYEKKLASIEDILAPYIEQFGYTV